MWRVCITERETYRAGPRLCYHVNSDKIHTNFAKLSKGDKNYTMIHRDIFCKVQTYLPIQGKL